MKDSNFEEKRIPFDDVVYDTFSMNKSSDADTMEDSETVGICNGHDEGKIFGLIADIECMQDTFEEYECRLSVAAMVSDAVTNGIVKAVLEESSEALAAKEAEILALNDKLEERDLKLWSISRELDMNIAENNSERKRLISDFMYHKEKMMQKLLDAEKRCVEKEKQLEAQTKSITQMELMLESEKHRMIAIEEQMKSLQDVETANKRKISNLVQELNRVKSQDDSQNKLEMEDNMQGVQSSYMGQPVEKEEYEEQMLKQELEQYVCESIYEAYLSDIRDAIERDQLHSSTIISNAQNEMQNLKEYSETLTEQSMQNETSDELQPSAIVGVLETSIQRAHHHISQLIEELGTKDGHIGSLILMMSSLVQESKNLESQVSSNNVIGGEIENNYSTLSFAIRNRANQSVQDLAQERTKPEDSISMLTGFEVQYDTFADRLREEQISLEQVEEKLAESQLERGIELDFIKEVDGSKGNEFMQLITSLNSKLEQKDSQIASYLESSVTLKAALNAERSEVLRLQEQLNGLTFQIDSLSSISLQKLGSVFDTISSKFLKMILSVDGFEETSKICFEHIQSNLASFEEEFLEQQWKKIFEEEISGIVLMEFLEGLEDQFKEKELENTACRVMQVRWDEGRLTLMNEIKKLRQELELLKIDEPLKYPLAADGGNSNGFQYISLRTQELKNGEATDAQKKDLATRRHSISHVNAYTSKADENCSSQLSLEAKNGEANDDQKKDLLVRRLSTGELSADKSHLDDCSVSTATGKTLGEHSMKIPDLSWNVFEILDSPDSPLKTMSKDQLISHFKRVFAEQKRHTECIVEEKTEEIYKLKRELLNKGMHLKKDKDLHSLKKRIADVTRQLDKVVEEDDKLSSHVVEDQDQNYALIFKLKDELQVEKRHLHGKVREKQNELKALSDKLSNALRTNTDHCLRESLLLNRIADLNSEREAIHIMNMCEVDILITLFKETMKEKQIESNLIFKEWDEIINQNVSLEKMMSEKDRVLNLACREKDEHIKQIAYLESERELIDIMNLYEVDILSTLVKETIKEKEIALNLMLNELDENIKKKLLPEKLMHEKDWPLDLAIGEKEELKKQISLLDNLIEEKKNNSGLAQSQLEKIGELGKPKSSLDLTLQFENIIKSKDDRIDSMRKEQEELKKQVLSLNEVIKEKEAALTMAMRDLEQASKVNISQEGIIQDKENVIEMSLKKEQYQSTHFEAIITEKENALAVASRSLKEHEATLVSMQEALKHKELCLQSALKDIEEGDKQKHVLQEDLYAFKAKHRSMQMQTADAQRQYERDISESFRKNMDAALQLEGRAMEKAQEYVLRLEQTKQHMKKLQRQAGAYVQKNLYYKEQLEIKCRNLLKAEEEVDLLGDDIDALLILLEKVYMGLDHYLPVLQHYPGIADLVKLIKKELMARIDS